MALLSRKLRHFRRRGSRSRAHDVCGPSRRGGDIARRNPIPVNGYLVQRFIAALHTASTRCQSQSGRYEESLLDRRQRMIIFSRRCRRLGFENNEDTRYLSCDELLISSYLVLSRLIAIVQVHGALPGGSGLRLLYTPWPASYFTDVSMHAVTSSLFRAN